MPDNIILVNNICIDINQRRKKLRERLEDDDWSKDKNSRTIHLNKKRNLINGLKQVKGITLVALVITIIFSYDEKLKCSNSKGFLLQTI